MSSAVKRYMLIEIDFRAMALASPLFLLARWRNRVLATELRANVHLAKKILHMQIGRLKTDLTFRSTEFMYRISVKIRFPCRTGETKLDYVTHVSVY